jgi:hypothetical protein
LKNSKEELILSALLSCPTVREASSKCGVPESTIRDYLAKPEFMERYKAAKADIVKGVSTKIQNKMSEAVDVVSELMESKDTPSAVRLNASKVILDQGTELHKTEQIIERIEKLENAFSAKSRR